MRSPNSHGLIALALAVTMVCLVAVIVFLFPAPPSRVPVAVGFKGGAYEVFFARYKELLGREGIDLEYRSTDGAVANQKLLDDPQSDIQLGFVQGGIEDSKQSPNLVSLGRLAYQPFYLFYRADKPIDDLSQLRGTRVAIGAPGNGSAVAAKKILAAAGVTSENTVFLPAFSQAGVDALKSGQADAVFEAFSNESVVRAALRDPKIKILSIRGAEALTRLFPFLSKITLPEGVIDYERNVPSSDVVLISTTVGLLARSDLHPAIITLLADALQKTHGGPGLFEKPGEFPTQSDPEFPMASAALDYYRSGTSFINRYIPFWVTHTAQRFAALLIAFFGVFLPIIRYAPQTRVWWYQRRFYQWYSELETIESSISRRLEPARDDEIRSALIKIERAEQSSRLPASFTAQRFELRSHIDRLRRKLAEGETKSQSRMTERVSALV